MRGHECRGGLEKGGVLCSHECGGLRNCAALTLRCRFFSGGKAQPSFSGKHSNASAKRLAVLEVPLGMSLRVEEKIIIYYYFFDRGLRLQFDFEGSLGCAV